MRWIIGIILLCSTFVTSSAQGIFDVVLKVDFEGNNTGPYLNDEIINDWGRTESINSINGVINDINGNKVWDVLVPEGAHSTGAQFITFIEGGYTELYISYNCMFKPGFGFMRGGKMPGLCGTSITGYGIPVGGVGLDMDVDDGFSARSGFKWNGAIGPYIYHHDLSDAYGEHLFLGDPIDVSEPIWYNVTYRVVLNTFSATGAANYDGILEGFLDGELKCQKTNLRWRLNPRISINTIMTSTFFGGSSDLDKPLRDEWIRFDDFYVFTYAPGVDVPRGNTPSEAGRILELPNLLSSKILLESDPEPPFPPENVRVTDAEQTSIRIAWDQAEDNVGVTGYRTYLNNRFVSAVTGLSYTFTGLVPDSIYLISVSAFDAATNESPISFPILGKTRPVDIEPPTTPTGVTVTRVTGYSIEFSWNASQDDVGVELYEIRLNGEFVALVRSTSYFAGGLDPGKSYTITIKAIDAAGNSSAFSNPVTRVTGSEDNVSPTKPTGLKGSNITNHSVDLNWNPSSDNVAVNGYKIYMNNELRIETSSTNATVSGLVEGLNYVVSVSATDEAYNESQKSDTIHVKTINEDATTSPTLPEIEIVKIQDKTTTPEALSEMKSFGYTELRDFGIIATRVNKPIEEGLPLYAVQYQSTVENRGRNKNGLQVFYNFSESGGTTIHDLSGVGEPVDLTIIQPVNTSWLPGQGLKISGNATLLNVLPSERLTDSLASSNEVTVEAWIRQSLIEQTGPASIITFSSGSSGRAFSLGHIGNKTYYNYVSRLNTTETDVNGLPELTTSKNFTSLSLHHLVFTRNSIGKENIYINGQNLKSSSRMGDFSSWENEYQLVLGNEIAGDHPWEGIFYLVAIYNRALDKEEILANYNAGLGQVRFETDLSILEPNTSYNLSPFVKTDQGIVYGDSKSFKLENVLYSSEDDSIYIAIFPNPSKGDFKLHIECENAGSEPVFIRIADMSGQVLYAKQLEVSDAILNYDEDILLSSVIPEGLYSLILIVGNQSVARRLIIHG